MLHIQTLEKHLHELQVVLLLLLGLELDYCHLGQLVLCLLAGAAARTLQDTLWFFTYRFSLLPLAVTLPCFAALGALLPPAFYRAAARRSLVERLRQAE